MENQPTQLSITDLAVLKNIIDLACSRGAFRAPEMKSVGEVYDKLSTFLDTVIKQAEAEMQAGQQGDPK
jgi:hypothetical protein